MLYNRVYMRKIIKRLINIIKYIKEGLYLFNTVSFKKKYNLII